MISIVTLSPTLKINIGHVTRVVDHPKIAGSIAGDYIEVYFADGSCQEYAGDDAALLRGLFNIMANQFAAVVNAMTGAGGRIVTPGV